MRENKMLKKQIKLLMIELNKKRRWFQRCIKSFKSSRQKWIKKQEEALKKKWYLIKYVFLDDVKRIQGYKEKPKGGKGSKGKGKKYKNKVYVLPKKLDEKVAKIHLNKIGAKLTKLSKEQGDYINVPVGGPYKNEEYRY